MSQTQTALENAAQSSGFRFENTAEMMDFFKKFGSNGRTFQDFTALTPESMEVLYSVAYNYYTAGKFDDAENVFQLLSVLNHFERKYWKGLAASRENQGKYEDALKAYGYIAVLDITDPYAPFHAGKCLICLGRASDAESAFTAAIHNAEGKEEHAELKAEAEGLLKVLAKSNSNANSTPSNP
jgi:type III secretion system low calcium response chaperone LcrH/SycD